MAYFTASCDSVEVNTKFAKKLELDYPILSDPGREAARAYGVVNDSRKVPFRYTFYIGPKGKLLHVDRKVNSGSHGADVVGQLKELGVKEK